MTLSSSQSDSSMKNAFFRKPTFNKWSLFLFCFVCAIIIIVILHRNNHTPIPESEISVQEPSILFDRAAKLPECSAVVGNNFALIQTNEPGVTYLCKLDKYSTCNTHCWLELLASCNKIISLDNIGAILITTSSPGIYLGCTNTAPWPCSSLSFRLVYRTILFNSYDVYIYNNNNKCEKYTFTVCASSKSNNQIWDKNAMPFSYRPKPQKGSFPIWTSEEIELKDTSPKLEIGHNFIRESPRCFLKDEMYTAYFGMKYNINYVRVNEASIMTSYNNNQNLPIRIDTRIRRLMNTYFRF